MIEFMKKYAYSCCLIWLLCVGILTNINMHYHLNVHEAFVVLICFLWAVLIQLFDNNKKNVIPYLVIGMLLLITSIVVVLTDFSLSKETKHYWSWLTKAVNLRASDNLGYSMFTVVLLALILLLIFNMILKQYRIRLVVAILLFLTLIVISVMKASVSKIGVICFLTFLILCIVEVRLSGVKWNQRKESGKAMPFLLPFLFLFLFMLIILPTNEKPIEWKLVKQFLNQISDSIDSLVASIDLWLNPEKSEFSLSFAGYTESGEVGGTLTDSRAEAIHIKTSTSVSNNIYLTGNTKNYFDGSKWTMTLDQEKNDYGVQEYILDLGETLYAIDRFNTTEDLDNLYKTRNLTISYRDIRTKSLFYPIKFNQIELTNTTDYYQSQTENIRFQDVQGKNTTYKVEYVNLNYGSTLFDEFLRQQGMYRYQSNPTNQEQQFLSSKKDNLILKGKDLPSDFEKLLYQRAQQIRKNYTKVYEGLPKRVALLSQQITSDYTNDYEKLLALEAYFSTYTYTTVPKQVPEGEDIIDYLLFTSQEGYCTYYATAFAIMARCIGIPTRFVQGFCIDTVNQKSKYEYMAYNSDAHAWVEAYIEGVGWIAFEPTPTYKTQRYQPWSSVNESVVIATPSIVRPTIDMEDFLLEQQKEEESKKAVYQGVMMGALVIILLIIVMIPIYFLIRIKFIHRRYLHCTPKEKIYYDIYQILQILAMNNRRLLEGETFSQYMRYIETQHPKMNKEMSELELIFIRTAYNDEAPTEQNQQEVLLWKEQLLKKVKEEISLRKYIMLRYEMLFQNWFRV